MRVMLLPVIACLLVIDRSTSYAVEILFLIAGLTDVLDGFLARRLNKVSLFGAMLDQICDKIFIIGTLTAMAAAGLLQNWMLVPVLVIITREFAVAGLREYAAINRYRLPVDKLGKFKTAFQFIAIAWMLLPTDGEAWLVWVNHIGAACLWIAAVLGMISAVRYARQVPR